MESQIKSNSSAEQSLLRHIYCKVALRCDHSCQEDCSSRHCGSSDGEPDQVEQQCRASIKQRDEQQCSASSKLFWLLVRRLLHPLRLHDRIHRLEWSGFA